MSNIQTIIERSTTINNGDFTNSRTNKYNTYAISNFRGGIGKSTLSFNLSFEISKHYKTLMLDTCSQRNLSQNIFGESLVDMEKSIYDALVSKMTNTSEVPMDDIVFPVKHSCQPFMKNKQCFMVPGSAKLFLFPSLLYSQLAQYAQLDKSYKIEASKKTLTLINDIISSICMHHKLEKTLIDTSPFFGGATHLSWCAAEALIIPVRVDQHSIEALDLTLKMLNSDDMDFVKFNQQGGLSNIPKVHAIAMTHCGWNRQKKNTPDRTTQFFVEKALEIAQKYSHLFSENDVTKCFYLFDDFHACGRISGKFRIPISKLNAGETKVIDGQRLIVTPSVGRYANQIQNLANDL
jgi:cellulose biosynthesis protein BcsQ